MWIGPSEPGRPALKSRVTNAETDASKYGPITGNMWVDRG
jgi:hypothetical protein